MKPINSEGSLVVVGTGISVAGQMTLMAQSYIENADIVFLGIANKIGENVVKKLNPNTVELDDLYQKGKSRAVTYQEMADRIVDAVKAGNKVCAAFYGHPGVFVNPSHAAIEKVKALGFRAEMLPGVSAEDCLIADLGIDPARYGCQSYEATQFLFREYTLDPYMTQIIWQIGLAGEVTLGVLDADHCKPGLALYAEILQEVYPADHEIILYEAATFPLYGPRIARFPLSELPNCKPTLISTLVVPSLGLPIFNEERLAKLGLTKEKVLSFRQKQNKQQVLP
ncbi:MAG: SAM-dependent methyltransferase [Aestuariibacter sp.]